VPEKELFRGFYEKNIVKDVIYDVYSIEKLHERVKMLRENMCATSKFEV